MPTGPPHRTVRVEFRIMVQRGLVARMLVAEDMPAMPAVVPPFKKVEGFMADRGVTDRGLGIGFPVLARGRAFDGREILVVVIVGFGGYGGGFVLGDFA